MSRFDGVLNKLRSLQIRLQTTSNRLWSIKLSLASAFESGHQEDDFLPRRLVSREQEQQRVFEQLLSQLHRVIAAHLEGNLIAFSSLEDVQTVAQISKTIRYLYNSFAGEPPLSQTLARLNAALPSYSRN